MGNLHIPRQHDENSTTAAHAHTHKHIHADNENVASLSHTLAYKQGRSNRL